MLIFGAEIFILIEHRTMKEMLLNVEYEQNLFSRLGASKAHVHGYINTYTRDRREDNVFTTTIFSRI
jgi:hypothetical protein